MANLDINNTFKRRSSTYRLVVTNDDTYDEVIAFRLSRKSVYMGLSIAFMFLVGLTIALIAFTPLKYYIPGYGTKESRSALELLKIRTDSLEQAVHFKEQYIEGIKKVLSEGNPQQLDTIPLQLPELTLLIFLGKYIDQKMERVAPLFLWILPSLFIVFSLFKIVRDTQQKSKK